MSGLGQCDNTGTETHSFNTFCVLDCTFHQMCDQDNILDPFLVLFGKARTMGMGNSLFFPGVSASDGSCSISCNGHPALDRVQDSILRPDRE